jgi:hypothetical protein
MDNMTVFRLSTVAVFICVALCKDQPPLSVHGVGSRSVVHGH